jgi:integrase
MSRHKSSFASKIDAMFEFRIARGYIKDERCHRHMELFDAFCFDHYPDETVLTNEIVHEWLDNETAKGASVRHSSSSIRQFGKYLLAIGEEAYVLPEKFAHHINRMIPYMLTDGEMTLLFDAIDHLQANENEPFLPEIMPIIFRLIYTCGLRPNEGRELLRENVDLQLGKILITHTKRNKERIVMMSDDMLALCRSYDLKRSIFGSSNPYFFPSYSGGSFTAHTLYRLLNSAWFKASISSQNLVPRTIRVYDLRHRFASARLNLWLDSGENIMAMLPFLRAYMGHDKISETAYYVHLLPENLVKSSGIDWSELNTMIPEVDKCPL